MSGQLQSALEVPIHDNASGSLPTPSEGYAEYVGLISQDTKLWWHILLARSRKDLRGKGSYR